ncbi:MAG TPA: epoxyqueuosine reductase QueH [Candidatus Cloacimonadota bacterium]|nr:epoxyqueuosine reductase QueH [Candidatus Cloacimonadota bacterium]HPT72442.1 epoxyqueuosine reductase QueH [Candidatus Cloacimonadota bacterium]
MKLLIHTCCAPCLGAPLKHLREETDFELTGFWFNPNIHPFQEYKRRLDTLRDYTEKQNLPMIYDDYYGLVEFTRGVSGKEDDRCGYCYETRLVKAAATAQANGFDAFTSTLLYSRYQKHDLIHEIGERIAREFDIQFYYADWRKYWQEGIEISKAAEMYRQQYCGCIYSEADRYMPKAK